MLNLRDRFPASRDESGMTLIEVMVAIFVLSVAILAMAATASSSLVQIRTSRDRQFATAAAAAALEQARSYEFNELGHVGDPSTCNTFAGDPNVDTATCTFRHNSAAAPETLVHVSGGKIDPYVTQPQANVTVRTYVTWYDDPEDPGVQDAKRVTAFVQFGDPDRQAFVRQSTLVSEARRGLPVPDFSITPTNPGPDASDWSCFTHTLMNHGGDDRYDFQIVGGDPAEGGYSFKYQNWYGRAWLGETSLVLAKDSSVRMFDQTGDLIPDSQIEVQRNQSRTLRVCYSPVPATTPPSDVVFTVRIRSAFDSSVVRDVTNHLVVPPGTVDLFLHDDTLVDNTTPTDGTWTPDDLAFVMDETVPSRASLVNYDSNRDAFPGLHLEPAGTTSATEIVRWDRQFPGSTSVSGSASLTIWTQLTNASDVPTDGTLALDVSLSRINTSDSGRNLADFAVTGFSYVHDDEGGWVGQSITISIPSAVSFEAGEFLRLSVACGSTTTGRCNLAYDVSPTVSPPYPATLRVSP